jgi:hypothetical protein
VRHDRLSKPVETILWIVSSAERRELRRAAGDNIVHRGLTMHHHIAATRDFRLIRLAMLVTIVTASAAFCLLTGGNDLLMTGRAILGAGLSLLIG